MNVDALREAVLDAAVALMSASPTSHADSDAAKWRHRAACLGMGLDLFFERRLYALGLATCGRCAVVQECRKATDEAERGDDRLFGVFGGETPAQRRARRGRARRNGHASL